MTQIKLKAALIPLLASDAVGKYLTPDPISTSISKLVFFVDSEKTITTSFTWDEVLEGEPSNDVKTNSVDGRFAGDAKWYVTEDGKIDIIIPGTPPTPQKSTKAPGMIVQTDDKSAEPVKPSPKAKPKGASGTGSFNTTKTSKLHF